jgi:hypothetical protein
VRTVIWINGLLGGLLTAAGSVITGYVCDRMKAPRVYILAGVLTAACSAGIALAPINGTTYAVGASVYLFVTGCSNAAFTAMALYLLGRGRLAAASGYSLLISTGNLSVTYSQILDGQGHRLFGPAGVFIVDAILNGVFALVLLVCWRASSELRKPAPEAGPTA